MMDTKTTTYRQIQTLLRELSLDELIAIQDFVQVLINSERHAASYDAEHDPFLTGEGLFYGPADLSDRTEELLYDDERHSAYQPQETDELTS